GSADAGAALAPGRFVLRLSPVIFRHAPSSALFPYTTLFRSEPYTVSPGVIVVKEDNDSIASFADLDGKTTAQSLTSNWYALAEEDRKSTRLNSSHVKTSYAVFCLKKKRKPLQIRREPFPVGG